MKQYEVIVIGGGPGGYEAALKLGDADVKTLLVEKNKEHIGGTCLNEGCIPTKNYLQSAKFISNISHFNDCGVSVQTEDLNLSRLKEKTNLLKNEIRSGVVWMLEQSGVESLYGTAHFIDNNSIEVNNQKIGFDKCIIATGSKIGETPLLPIDGKDIISSDDMFKLNQLPKSIIIVGVGAIGCEAATFFNAFGVDVTLVARSARLLKTEDEDISKALLRTFKKQNIKVITSANIQEVKQNGKNVELIIQTDTIQSIKSQLVLCATGRVPYSEALGLENAGVEQDEKGFIEVSPSFQTSQNNIYAVGDCIDTPAFAHTAYAEAKITAKNIIENMKYTNTHITPTTIFTNPAIASCGLKEIEAKAKGYEIEIKKAFFKVNARAKIYGDDSGFAKIIVCVKSDMILGASIIGVEATEIIHELVLAIEKKLTYNDLKNMIHAHPTVSEIVSYL
ncbi:MAG: dihydrolipoyl dehydrogenase [Arcobacteraceae bacterium]|nr:dihydrolipoyl dehydrogenase [Arcobacteraceae bacterium]